MADKNGPVRLGIIGSGLAVKHLHWPALKKMTGKYEVVMTCDVNESAAQEVAALAAQDLNSPDCKWTTDYKEVLANEAVEAVLLSLPIHLNAQFMLDAARAGKHIICEKPLASNLAQARELVTTLASFDRLVVEIAENFHYRADLHKAQEWLKAGRIGEPFLIEIHGHFWTDTSKGFGSTPWRWDNQYRGGVVADAGVHLGAVVCELGGPVEQLQAFAKSVHPVMGGHDTIVANIRYRNGVLGNLIIAGAVMTEKNQFLEATVYGTSGSLHLGSDGKVILKQNDTNTAHVTEEYTAPDYDSGYLAEFENFYAAIREDAPVVATPEVCLRDWEIIMYALDSAESRSVILF